jgi:hypothetical protein
MGPAVCSGTGAALAPAPQADERLVQVVHFFRQVIGVPILSKEVIAQRTNDYQKWVEAFAGNHQIPIQWAEKGVRKEDYVLPWLRQMRKKGAVKRSWWSAPTPIRVLTTSARKPPLRADKFAALWRIATPVHPIRSSNCAESGYCELIRPRKGLTSNNEASQLAETAWSNGKSAIFGLKTAHLNGGFRLDVVSRRGPSATRAK